MKPTTLILVLMLLGVGVGGVILINRRTGQPPVTPANNGTPNQSPGGCQRSIGQLTALGSLTPDPRGQAVSMLGQNKFAQDVACGALNFVADPTKALGGAAKSAGGFLKSDAGWVVPPAKLSYEVGKGVVKGAKAVGKAISNLF